MVNKYHGIQPAHKSRLLITFRFILQDRMTTKDRKTGFYTIIRDRIFHQSEIIIIPLKKAVAKVETLGQIEINFRSMFVEQDCKPEIFTPQSFPTMSFRAWRLNWIFVIPGFSFFNR